MSDVRASNQYKLARNIALMASASVLSILMAGEAEAACTPGPINNVPANTVVTCTGTINSPGIHVGGANSSVILDPGTIINGGGITLAESNNAIHAIGTTANPITLDDVSIVSTSGGFSNRQVNLVRVNANNLTTIMVGDNTLFNVLNGSTLTLTPGNFYIEGGSTQASRAIVNVTQGSNINAIGPGNGQYLIGTGNRHVEMNFNSSTLTTASDNRLIRFGGGDDALTMIGMTLNPGGAGPLLIDGGTGDDSFLLDAGAISRSYDLVVTGFENAVFKAAAGQTLTLTGSADYNNVTIGNGIVRINDFAALGASNANVQIDSNATLELNHNNNPTLNYNFSGGGTLRQVVGLVAYNGNSGGFSGNFILDDFRAYLLNANAMGSATITNNALLYFGDFNLANTISGTGIVAKFGPGIGTLSGNNSHNGGTWVLQGGLVAMGVNTLGTGVIQSNVGTTLTVNAATNQVMANAITGGLAFIKEGVGILDLTGTNTYSGGTTINAGAIRVDDLARLGTGPVVANANASLILNYSNAAPLTLANPFLSGAGQFVKQGSGEVVVDAANGYTGGTRIDAGMLRIASNNALGNGAIQVASGGTLALGTSAFSPSVSNDLYGSGTILIDQVGGAELNGNNSAFTGAINLTASSSYLAVYHGDNLGSGSINLNGTGTLLQIDTATNSSSSASINGNGTVEKYGAGTIALTGAGGMTGGAINVFGGTLQIEGSNNIGNAPTITLASSTVLNLATNQNRTLANNVAGTGSIIKTGTGTVELTGTNSYSGGINIQQGALRVTNVGLLGTGPVTVQSGAALDMWIAGTATLSQAISGAGILRKSNSGDLTLTANGLTGGVDITGGRVIVSSSAALGSGPVTTAANTILVFDNSAAATLSSAISGAGTLRKQGTGTLTFNNNFTIANLALAAGRTRLNAVATTNVNVASGATLDGTGRVIGTLTNNGIVAPGNSIGTLTVQGNYVHNSGSILEIEFDGSGGIDLLSVTGSATINGGTLRFVSLGGAEGNGGTFLTATGGITGTFATIETVGAQLPLAVIYQPNSAIMAPSVLTARPSTFNAQSLAAADTTFGFIDSIGVADVRRGEGSRIWLTGFGSWGKRSASGSTLGYDHDSHGMSGGVNIDAGSGVTLGAAIGWTKSDISLASNGGGGKQSSVIGSAHVRYAGTGFTLGAGAVYGNVDQDTLRNVSFNSFSASVNGETSSKIFGGFAELGVPLGTTGNWSFSANARGSYIQQMQDAYTESGTSPLRLSVGEIKADTLEGRALLTAKTSLIDFGGNDAVGGLDLRIDAGARYLGALGDRNLPVTFAASNAGIVLQGDQRDNMHGLFGLALDYTTPGGMTFSVGYRGEVGETDRHSAQVGLNFAF